MLLISLESSRKRARSCYFVRSATERRRVKVLHLGRFARRKLAVILDSGPEPRPNAKSFEKSSSHTQQTRRDMGTEDRGGYILGSGTPF